MTTTNFSNMLRLTGGAGGGRRAWRAETLLFAAALAAATVPRVSSHVATLTPFGFTRGIHGINLLGIDRRGRSMPFLRKKITRDFDELANLMSIADAFMESADPFSHYEASSKHGEGSANRTLPLKLRCPNPTLEWEHCEGGMVLHAATPGLKKEDLSIKIVDEAGQRYLVVSGETKDQAADEDKDDGKKKADKDGASPTDVDKLHQRYYYENFEHRVQLPSGVTSEGLTAKYEDGMLTINLALPQEKPPQAETIAIA
mmetsp:Transcript_26852/g.62177  ORF Transcript_26852/g.62177 Transcript_26852/m.62177 type:complete len:258 (-) Transcript_26852:227-1000(-)